MEPYTNSLLNLSISCEFSIGLKATRRGYSKTVKALEPVEEGLKRPK